MKILNLILLFALLIAGCKKDVEFRVYPCENKIDLGEFPLSDLAKAIPYDSLKGISFIDNEGHGCMSIIINDPLLMEKPLQWNRKSSDCENSNNPNEYLLLAEEKFTNLMIWSEIEFDDNGYVLNKPPSLMIRVTSNFEDENEIFGKKGEVLEIYDTGGYDSSGGFLVLFQDPPFLSISLFDDPNQDSDTDFGYEFHSSIDLNGKRYSDVFVNSTPLLSEAQGGITHIYFSLKDGLVGMKDLHDNTWTSTR